PVRVPAQELAALGLLGSHERRAKRRDLVAAAAGAGIPAAACRADERDRGAAGDILQRVVADPANRFAGKLELLGELAGRLLHLLVLLSHQDEGRAPMSRGEATLSGHALAAACQMRSIPRGLRSAPHSSAWFRIKLNICP